MAFGSVTLENQNPGKATILAAGFKGVAQIEYGKAQSFRVGTGLNIACEGIVLFDVMITEDQLQVKARDEYDDSKFKVVFSVHPGVCFAHPK